MNNKKMTGILKKSVAYVRELSIVIIGIVITLAITNAFNNRQKQKEIKETVNLIKRELLDNLQMIEDIQSSYNKDISLLGHLYRNMDDIRVIPADTLQLYGNRLGFIFPMLPYNDAFDVFKASALMPYVKDKAFLFELFQVYKHINILQLNIDAYLEYKERSTQRIGSPELLRITDKYEYFSKILKFQEVQSFVITGPNVFNRQEFSKTRIKIEQMIEWIDKEYLNE